MLAERFSHLGTASRETVDISPIKINSIRSASN